MAERPQPRRLCANAPNDHRRGPQDGAQPTLANAKPSAAAATRHFSTQL